MNINALSFHIKIGVIVVTKKNIISIVTVLVFGFVLFYIGTDGFQAYTAETARVHKLVDERPELPQVELEDSKERTYSFDEFEGKYMMMTFVYTRCTTVCPQLEMNFQEVFESIDSDHLGEDIVFLTVSFDPERDTPEILDKYRTYFGSDGDTWRMARVNEQEELDELLDRLGVIVIPDGDGDFAHNVAFYLIDQNGKLMDVLDYDDILGAQEKVNQLLAS